MLRSIGDLFAEVGPFAEYLAADDVHDVFGAGVGLREDERFRDVRATGKKLRRRTTESLEDGTNLILRERRRLARQKG
jgi:hypothetical protein